MIFFSVLLTACADAGDDDERLPPAALEPEFALVGVGAAVGAAHPLADQLTHAGGHARARGGALAPPAHARRVQVARQVGAPGWRRKKERRHE